MTTSLTGTEQHGRIFPSRTSRGRIPPWWSISTSPLTFVALHVPHTPSAHEDGCAIPASRAASRIVIPFGHCTVQPAPRNSTE